MFDFRRIIVFSLGYRLSKPEIIMFWKSGVGMAP